MTATAVISAERRDIPTLDGLRAISIACVLLSHFLLHTAFLSRFPYLAEFGSLGVEIFFGISGYLITTLLLREFSVRRAIDIPRFYLRRVTRIFPAYYVFLGLCALAVWVGVIVVERGRWWPALAYVSNLVMTNVLIGHSWSLSVEEQFYLTWPLALAALGPRRAWWVAIAVFVSGPLMRVALYGITHDGFIASSWNHDFIAAGCMMALSEQAPELRVSRRLELLLQSRWIALAPLGLVALHLAFGLSQRWVFAARVGAVFSVEAVLVALTLAWCVRNPSTIVGRALEWRPLRAVGVLSYSLYLWQQPFLFNYVPIPRWTWLPASFVCAWLSYRLIELPALTLRKRFAHRSTSRAALATPEAS